MVSFLALRSLDSKACSFHLFRNVRFCCWVVGTSCGLFWCGEQERLALFAFRSMLTCFWIQKLSLFLHTEMSGCKKCMMVSCGLLCCREQERLILFAFWSLITCFWIQKLALFLHTEMSGCKKCIPVYCWDVNHCSFVLWKRSWVLLCFNLFLLANLLFLNFFPLIFIRPNCCCDCEVGTLLWMFLGDNEFIGVTQYL